MWRCLFLVVGTVFVAHMVVASLFSCTARFRWSPTFAQRPASEAAAITGLINDDSPVPVLHRPDGQCGYDPVKQNL